MTHAAEGPPPRNLRPGAGSYSPDPGAAEFVAECGPPCAPTVGQLEASEPPADFVWSVAVRDAREHPRTLTFDAGELGTIEVDAVNRATALAMLRDGIRRAWPLRRHVRWEVPRG